MRAFSKVFVVLLASASLAAGLVATAPAAFGQDVERFCGKALVFQTGAANTAGVDPDKPETIKAYARKVANGLKKLSKLAPTAELRKDMKTVAKNYAKIAKSGDLSQNVSVDPQLRIQDYITANCAPPTT